VALQVADLIGFTVPDAAHPLSSFAMAETVTACLLIIGNEILSGRTQDENLRYVALGLNDVGVRLTEVRVIPDVPETIVSTVNAVRRSFDYVFTTGGIGPTHDDITSECIAKAFGVPWQRDPKAVAILEAYIPGGLNEARLRMATVPKGAELIQNPVSAAPGFRMENVYVMAGVPAVMKAMFDNVKRGLRGGAKMSSRSVRVELAEGAIAETLSKLQDANPDVEIGSYPAMRRGSFGVSVVIRGTDEARLDAVLAALKAGLIALGGVPQDETGMLSGQGASA
jgi:molybdenum cofactor synthesis domain-containing protein